MKQYFGFIVLVSLLAVMTGCSSGGDDGGASGGGDTPAAVCDTTHLSLCTIESTCVSASGNWYSDSCHSDPSGTWDVMEWDKGQWK